MSHFNTYVIVPKGTEPMNIEVEVKRLLAPFDESLAVGEYETNCYCVGGQALQKAIEEADRKHGTYDDLRASFVQVKAALIPTGDEEQDDDNEQAAWNTHRAEREQCEHDLFAADPRKNEPDASCKDCKGTGKVMSTYSPKSKWDWWVIGGRWDGSIQGTNLNEDQDWKRVYTDAAHELRNNVRSSDELKVELRHRRLIPFSVVTPDGEWHECGKMGWWGIVKDKKGIGEWAEMVTEIVASYPGHWVVSCDLHI